MGSHLKTFCRYVTAPPILAEAAFMRICIKISRRSVADHLQKLIVEKVSESAAFYPHPTGSERGRGILTSGGWLAGAACADGYAQPMSSQIKSPFPPKAKNTSSPALINRHVDTIQKSGMLLRALI